MARDGGVGQLDRGDGLVNGSVELDRSLKRQLGSLLAGKAGGLDNRIHVHARTRGAGRVGEHGNLRIEAELARGRCRGNRDICQLLGGRVGVDCAVAECPHAILQQHEENRRNDRDTGGSLNDLEGRNDGVSGGVDGA